MPVFDSECALPKKKKILPECKLIASSHRILTATFVHRNVIGCTKSYPISTVDSYCEPFLI